MVGEVLAFVSNFTIVGHVPGHEEVAELFLALRHVLRILLEIVQSVLFFKS